MLRNFAIFLLYVDLKENLFLLSEKHFGERLRIGKNGKKKTAQIGGKCEANNGITPIERG